MFKSEDVVGSDIISGAVLWVTVFIGLISWLSGTAASLVFLANIVCLVCCLQEISDTWEIAVDDHRSVLILH